MLEVFNKDSGGAVIMSLINPHTGIDCVADHIGDLKAAEIEVRDDGILAASDETIQFWMTDIARYQAFYNLLYDLLADFGAVGQDLKSPLDHACYALYGIADLDAALDDVYDADREDHTIALLNRIKEIDAYVRKEESA